MILIRSNKKSSERKKKTPEKMESDLQQNHHNLLSQNQMNSSLMRYKSAPSSYFANFLESEDCEEFLNQRATSPETERGIISRFFSTNAGEDDDDDLKPEINQFIAPMKVEVEDTIQNQHIVGDYSTQEQQIMYQNSNNCNSPLLNRSNSRDLGSAIEGSFRVPASSMGMDQFSPLKIGTGGSNSNLIRHSSSPAGLFSNINIENGFVTTMRGMSNLGGGNLNTTTNGETPYSSSNRMRSPLKFTPGPPSSSVLMSPIPEFDNKNIRSSSPENGNFGESPSNNSFINGFTIGSWDDSSLMGENFSGLKRPRDDDRNPHTGLNGYDNQNERMGNRLPHTPLSHHLSLPKTSNEMAAMEKLLQLEDSVPWKIRAKRGCATHPRSIAERVRRTRISERMRKLQELVPNMDKQTNTADMLDLAVDYIKDLQNEVKVLSESQAKCTCSSSHNI